MKRMVSLRTVPESRQKGDLRLCGALDIHS